MVLPPKQIWLSLPPAALTSRGFFKSWWMLYDKSHPIYHPKDAQTFVAEETKDVPTERARFEAALTQPKRLAQVDPAKLAAIGYCFGGGVVLDMVRLGVNLAAVATFHGALGYSASANKESFVALQKLLHEVFDIKRPRSKNGPRASTEPARATD